MMQDKEAGETPANNPVPTGNNQMATNPNPRANENVKGTSFDKNTKGDDTPDVGSEITDGTGG